MQKCCRECRYFVSHEAVEIRMQGINLGGECRCEPPNSHHQPFALGTFPVVLESDWCRRFKPRVDLHREAAAAALDLRRSDSMVPSVA